MPPLDPTTAPRPNPATDTPSAATPRSASAPPPAAAPPPATAPPPGPRLSRRRLTGALAGAGAALATAPTAAALGGCAAPARGGSGRPGDPLVLTLLSHYATEPLKSALRRALDEWNRTHPRVQVRSQGVQFADLLTTAMVRQTAGQGADILHPYALWTGQLATAGVLRPAPPEVARRIRDTFSPAAVQAVTVDGELYGYPTEVQTYALYYNRRLLREAGIARPPRTWPELEDAALATARRDRHGNTRVQGFGLSQVDDASVVGQTLALLAARGGRFLTRDGHGTAIDSAAGRSVLDLERRLIDQGAADPAVNLLAAFPAGQVALCVSAGWWTGSLKATMAERYREVGVAPVPGPRGNGRGTLATAFLLGVNADSRHPDEAWEFLEWLNARPVPVRRETARGEPGQRVRATRMSALQTSVGSMTGRADDMAALLGPGSDPNLAPFLDALRYAVPEPNSPHAQQAKTLLRKNIEAVWSGQSSVNGALQTASRQIDQVLARGR